MFHRFNLLITRCDLSPAVLAENINVNEVFSLKNFILLTYIYIFVDPILLVYKMKNATYFFILFLLILTPPFVC